ncbi:hypothetical protein MCGE09_00101 [Thaumarchaeota archaeon SCGC AB-539-E09]|nr:hypothetical protein MCGE09_00101 [Thaumarchaeota archaeon SCGC AB-539-E09]
MSLLGTPFSIPLLTHRN